MGGVSAAQFQACIADRALSDGILQTRLTAERDFGVNSTPTFSIGGRKINGALPYAQFKQIIDDVIAGKAAPDAVAGGSGSSSIYISVGIAGLLVAFAGFVLLRRPKASSSGPNR